METESQFFTLSQLNSVRSIEDLYFNNLMPKILTRTRLEDEVVYDEFRASNQHQPVIIKANNYHSESRSLDPLLRQSGNMQPLNIKIIQESHPYDQSRSTVSLMNKANFLPPVKSNTQLSKSTFSASPAAKYFNQKRSSNEIPPHNSPAQLSFKNPFAMNRHSYHNPLD